MTVRVSNPGPKPQHAAPIGSNNWAPSFGHRKMNLAAEVKRALRRRTDAEVCRSWGGLKGWKELKFDKPTTERSIRAELKRQGKRIGNGIAGPLEWPISAAGVERGSSWEQDTYNDWINGVHS